MANRAPTAAGMHVLAYPNRQYPPDEGTLRLATIVIDDLSELVPALDQLGDALGHRRPI